MRFERTGLDGLWLVHPEPSHDERGLFARVFCRDEFAAAGVPFEPLQLSVSYNHAAGTLRGMHWQSGPHAETKLVRVTRGRLFDVVVDLRDHSPTRLHWFGVELDADARTALLIPPGFAHGFITLQDATEVLYTMNSAHAPASACGARWNDPAFGIVWPARPRVISERDCHWPSFQPEATDR